MRQSTSVRVDRAPLVPPADTRVGSPPFASSRAWMEVLVRTPRGANGRVGRRGGQALLAGAKETIRRRTARFPIGCRVSDARIKICCLIWKALMAVRTGRALI